jgi:uncharacterized protein with von Willebrand factor type A (vWA) domain
MADTSGGTSDRYDVTDSVVGLAATLRAAGVPASHERVQAMMAALTRLDPRLRDDVYWAGRLTLCSRREDLPLYDRVFAAYFGDRPRVAVRGRRVIVPRLRVVAEDVGRAEDPADDDGGVPLGDAQVVAAASRVERLRHRDVGKLGADERAELNRLLAALRMPGESRPSRRHRPSGRGRIDRRRTLRAWLAAGGEPARLRRQRRYDRPRRVVLLVDVSGSMDPYADALLRFAHAAARPGGPPTEVFTLGTRLSRVTREMSHRDADAAMAAVAAVAPDAGGGTRLGELLKEFLDRWGQRGTARGAVVVLLSDGWERGDVSLLAEQVARLQRLAHRLVWANPRKGAPGFAPVAAGVAAALPHVDDFVEGHSLAALEHLAGVVLGRAGTSTNAGPQTAAPAVR